MENRIMINGMQVSEQLASFVNQQALPGTGISSERFWAGFSELLHDLGPKNRNFLAIREDMQKQIDDWHIARRGQAHDAVAYQAFLHDIGYLLPEGADFAIQTTNVDPEIASIAGPQLVVPIMNARFALNAANARWGSLYDALYGTDALGDLPAGKGYDPERGARVIAWGRAFLDDAVPLAKGSHSNHDGYRVEAGALVPALKNPAQFAGYRGDAGSPTAILLKNNGLHIIIEINSDVEIGANDKAHVADIRLESALSTIMDCEDSVAAVDAEDKVLAYSNWLGLMKG
ncbi:MAG TPA: malate synthase G, partial [Rhodobacteraceae bacterium]|nr:malate synthase G [Paracoccaceae bacterium]